MHNFLFPIAGYESDAINPTDEEETIPYGCDCRKCCHWYPAALRAIAYLCAFPELSDEYSNYATA